MHSACAQNWMKRLPTISHILSNGNKINKIGIEFGRNVNASEENYYLRFNAFEKHLIFVTLYIYIETHGSRCNNKEKMKKNAIFDFIILIIGKHWTIVASANETFVQNNKIHFITKSNQTPNSKQCTNWLRLPPLLLLFLFSKRKKLNLLIEQSAIDLMVGCSWLHCEIEINDI